MSDLLKEAIADAKAVRETALANAKMALEEAFTPQLQSILSAKLREDDDEWEDDEEPVGDEFPVEDPLVAQYDVPGEEEEIPFEEPDDVVAAGMYGEQDPVPNDEVPMDLGPEVDPELDVDMEEEGVIEINGVEYVPRVQAEDFAGQDSAPLADPAQPAGDGEEMFEDKEDKLDLESIIKELESELTEEDDAYPENVEGKEDPDHVGDQTTGVGDTPNKVSEQSDSSEVGKSANHVNVADANDEPEDVKEVVEIDDDLFKEEDDAYPEDVEDKKDPDHIENMAEELKEYKQAVRFLRDKLYEVNILNAKLLFTNKLFKEFALDNSQKLRVVETFDRAQSTREIKLVYSTLVESFQDGKVIRKSKIKESASTRTGSTRPSKGSRKVITEESQVAERFKKLAGLSK